MNKIALIFLRLILGWSWLSSEPLAFADSPSTTRLQTSTGAVVESLSLDVGDIYSGRVFERRFQISYSFLSSDPSATISIEPRICHIEGALIRNISAKVGGKSMLQIQDVSQGGFPLDLTFDLPPDLQGPINCQALEIRDMLTGREIANVTLNGFARRPPRWVSPTGEKLTEIAFSFDEQVAKKSSLLPIDSRPVQIRLVDAAMYPATALFRSPEGCSIGRFAVPDSSMLLVAGQMVIPTGSTWTITNASISNLFIRIDGKAGVADKSGRVSCGRSGSLTYTF